MDGNELLEHCESSWWTRVDQFKVTVGAMRGAGATAWPLPVRTRSELRCSGCGITAQQALAEADKEDPTS